MPFWIAVNVVSIAGLLAVLLTHVLPLSRAVKLRNAFLLEPSSPADFEWSPPAFPADFQQERCSPSLEFARAVERLGVPALASDWAKALALAGHLAEHARDRGPIQADLHRTYRGILEGYGYCADFTKVYLALAHAAGLAARQWAFSFDGFGGHGHAVVEVFDRQRGKWLFLDVFNNFHAVDTVTSEPLGALEFRDSLLGRRPPARMRPNGPGRPGYVEETKARDYYLRGTGEWYLWWGNAVFSQDRHPAVRLFAGQLAPVAAALGGLLPRIRVLPTVDNGAKVERLWALRRRVVWLTVALAVLALALAAQLAWTGTAVRAQV
jgi:hypothetical protein